MAFYAQASWMIGPFTCGFCTRSYRSEDELTVCSGCCRMFCRTCVVKPLRHQQYNITFNSRNGGRPVYGEKKYYDYFCSGPCADFTSYGPNMTTAHCVQKG